MLSRDDRDRVDAYRLLMADVYEMAATSRRLSETEARARGVTVTQWHVMSVLTEEAASVPSIARRLGLTRQAVQRTVDALVSAGHLAREANPSHRGSPLVVLTGTGRDILDALWNDSDAPRAAALAESEIDLQDLVRARRTLRELLRTL